MKKLFILFVLFAAAFNTYAEEEQVTLVNNVSMWRFWKGTSAPSSPESAWKEINFDDSSWQSALSPIHYGNVGLDSSDGTVLSDMRGNYSTIYIRQKFDYSAASCSSLKFNAVCDDGFIVNLNGVEVGRYNVYDGEMTYSSLSMPALPYDEWIVGVTFDLSDRIDLLKQGENVLSLHVLNCQIFNSTDFRINAELVATAEMVDTQAPYVINIQPTSGSTVSNPACCYVYFNEPVTGVTKSSLLSGRNVAEKMTQIDDKTYMFQFFAVSEKKDITINWNRTAKIFDRAGNAFEIPTTQWTYTVDPALKDEGVVINEFVADNSSGLKTKSGEYSDWIELYNSTSLPVDLSGYYLTDSTNTLTKWQFPAGTVLAAGKYMIVFANSWTGDPVVNGEYFANFSLSKNGEYLGLIMPDGETVVSEFAPSYPVQYEDVSYGIGGFYYKEPTPGAANTTTSYKGFSEKVAFSESGGYKEEEFTLTLSSSTEGASIYYTLDGTVPNKHSKLYTEPLKISTTAFVRAIAMKDGYVDSEVNTRTWIFASDVLATQKLDTVPTGWPKSGAVNGHTMEYGINTKIYSTEELLSAFKSIQTVSMVTDLDCLFSSSYGIYVNPSGDGENWERPASIEFINPATGVDEQIEAGIRIRGGFSRSSQNPKHSFRLFFRSDYGGKLKFPLFEDEGASVFSKVDLRTSQNYAWSYLAGNRPESNTFIRETFSRDAQGVMGQPYTRSRYYHLFINGQYWGLYQTQERGEANFAETYMGGDENDWDCIKTSNYQTSVADGTIDAFKALYNISINEGFTGKYATNYNRIKGLNPDGTPNPNLPIYLDEDNLIVHMLNAYWMVDMDSPVGLGGGSPNNLYALFNRVNPTGFKWLRHDAEHSMAANRSYGVAYPITDHAQMSTSFSNFSPALLHQKLVQHPDYMMRWSDLIQKYFLDNGGCMSTAVCQAIWDRRQAELDEAILLESARWGYRGSRKYTRQTWLDECDWVKNSFISLRTGYMVSEFKKKKWFPSVSAATLSSKGESISTAKDVRVTGSGTVYYTTDGSDPRLPGGSINQNAKTLEPVYIDEFVLLPERSQWDYYDLGKTPAREGTAYWYQPKHTHSGWKQGNGRFGFGPKSVGTQVNRLRDGSSELLTTAYFSTRFDVAFGGAMPSVDVGLNCDDGAIVYLNGSRVISHNMPSGYLTCDTFAASDVTGDDEDAYVNYTVEGKYLVTGENTVSVEIHRSGEGDTDLYFDLKIKTEGGYIGSLSDGFVQVQPTETLKVRVLSDSEWSPIKEASFPPVYGDISALKVTEMMYSPEDLIENTNYTRDDFAWIELQNTGGDLLNLEGVKFTSGIDYAFPAMTLGAGEYVVIAKNLDAFKLLYGEGIIPIGIYSGNLAHKGEKVTLSSATGDILTYTYSNAWYPETDKTGYSLVVRDTSAPEEVWSTSENWKPSSVKYGTPGKANPVLPDEIKIQGISVDSDGFLHFNVGTLAGFIIENSYDLIQWNVFEDYTTEQGEILIDLKKLATQSDSCFFRIKMEI